MQAWKGSMIFEFALKSNDPANPEQELKVLSNWIQ